LLTIINRGADRDVDRETLEKAHEELPSNVFAKTVGIADDDSGSFFWLTGSELITQSKVNGVDPG
jgi:hypothetical protein